MPMLRTTEFSVTMLYTDVFVMYCIKNLQTSHIPDNSTCCFCNKEHLRTTIKYIIMLHHYKSKPVHVCLTEMSHVVFQ